MILYRAIEFGKLQYLLNDLDMLKWVSFDLDFVDPLTVNWWMDRKASANRNIIMSSIFKNSQAQFFDKSAEFNSLRGGRFNPEKSFGAIYSSSNPFVSALEVLYHQFESIYKLHNILQKNKDQVQTSYNQPLSKKISILVNSFQFEIDVPPLNVFQLNEDLDSLKKLTSNVGFERYIGTEFSRDFIFGNDYEISQIIGCNFHTKSEFDALSVPSARIDFLLQDSPDALIRNYVIPESRLKKLGPALKKSYFEYRFEIEMDINSDGLYQVNVEVNDVPKGSIFLEPVPSKLNEFSKKQIKIYEHLTDLGLPRKLREVHTQKFV